MTRAETAKIQLMLLSALRLTRPIPDEEALLDAWHLALGDLDYAACQRAATVLLREERYFPEPSTVRDLVLKEMTGLPDTDEAWSLVTKWVRGGPPEHVFWNVNPLAQRTISEAIKGLGGLYNLRRSERPDRDRADFYKLWPELRRRTLRVAIEEPPPMIWQTNGTGYAAESVTLSHIPEGGDAIEDAGMGLVDYERQEPKPIPHSILAAPAGPNESR